MTDTPLTLITAEPPNETVVRTLEATLEQARRGELSSVAIAYVERDGSSGSNYSEAPGYVALIGATAVMQTILTRELI